MDGVIVDSEPLWKQAEKEVFSSLGVEVTEELCQITQHMKTDEVTQFWFDQHQWSQPPLNEVESLVVNKVISLIQHSNCIMPGLTSLVSRLKEAGFKLAIATNSPFSIIPHVLEKAGLTDCFDALLSSEFEERGKPHPDVYVTTLKQLGVSSNRCIAIEDSNSGILAAKRAGIKGIAFRNGDRNKIFKNAIWELDAFEDSVVSQLERITVDT
jgi:sugar-phosphatase